MATPVAPGPVQAPTGPVTLVLLLPPYRLSPNGTRNREERARLTKYARAQAKVAALSLPATPRPVWPTGLVRVDAEVALPKGQPRLDDDNAKALLKASLDGTQGIVVQHDRQLVWGRLTWSREPAAATATVVLTFTPEEPA